MSPTQPGSEFVAQQRLTLIRTLEKSRVEGVALLSRMMRGVSATNIDRVWPLLAPVVERLILAQQRQGRSVTLAYVAALGAGMGLGLVRARPPQASVLRDGLLPSGMRVSTLVYSMPMAIQHRLELGQPANVAWHHSLSSVVRAVNEGAHAEARLTTSDVLKAGGVDWDALDAEFDAKIEALRGASKDSDAYIAEQRRLMRNKSAKQKMMMGWGLSNGDPWATRYIRVPSAGACSFCLMLANRGPVYYKDSFTHARANHLGPRRFRANGDAMAHANCRCVLMPEPSPGAYKGVRLGDPEWYEGKVWTDPVSKRKYDLSRIGAEVTQVRELVTV
ncbi:MAG: hypothetical protein ACO28P_01430 [Ilumatobacteraceae bacterium]